eukprot:TRINITY_DN3390_c0_g1_i1.p1 TRINITY_DN3390_c0_g1~~TRINITY_DN3390_c0_g1_i1.p1  ORF type:complete len:441 (+),score=109.32 TRINITY_DN3390_c0_g1_i1:784-2106(+)
MASPSQKLLLAAPLSDSGRPVLQPSEVECLLQDAMSVEFEEDDGTVIEWATLRHGLCFLTTHRVIWIDDANVGRAGRRAFGLPFSAVASAQQVKRSFSNLWSSPRLRIRIHVTAAGEVARRGLAEATTGMTAATIVLVFRSQTAPPDPFILKFMQVLQARAWEADEPPVSAGAAKGAGPSAPLPRFNPAMAGVGGILRKEQEQQQVTEKSLQEAFSDLNALMAKARDMVQLAERMQAKLLAPARPAEGAEGLGEGEEVVGAESKQELQDLLLSVGIASPVTKESAGALYHQQLARQLADFLRKPLEVSGGMMAVVDAYCVFNRARGTELISPEDMLQACSVWEQINVPLQLRRFESGVKVIQDRSRSDAEMMARIQELVALLGGPREGLSATDAARALGLSPALAKEELLTAESRGILCRDDSVDGLRFHHNFFRDVTFP